MLASTAKAQSNIFSLPWAAAAAWRQEVREVNSRFLFGIWEKAQLRPWARQISCKQRLQLGTMVGGNLVSLIQAISAMFKLESGLIRPTYKEEVWFLERGEGGMFNCPPTLFPPQFLFSVTLTTQSPSPQTSLVFLHVELSLLHTVLENTFIRHYTFSGGAKIPVCWLQCFFFFSFFLLLLLGNYKNVFLTVVPILGFHQQMQRCSKYHQLIPQFARVAVWRAADLSS